MAGIMAACEEMKCLAQAQPRSLVNVEWAAGTGTEKGAAFGREAGTRRRLQDDGGVQHPSSARGCLNAE